MVVHGDALYDFLRPLFKRLERKQVKDALQGVQGEKHQLGIFGYNRMGPQVLQEIKKTGLNYLIVDHDPAVVEKLKKKGVEVVLGDVSNAEFLSEFDFKDMEIIISTIPNARTNRSLLQNFKILNPLGISILTAEERWEAIELYDLGADYVIVPHHLGGNHIELLLREFAQNKQRFTQERKKHLAELHGRKYE